MSKIIKEHDEKVTWKPRDQLKVEFSVEGTVKTMT